MSEKNQQSQDKKTSTSQDDKQDRKKEIGGQKGPEPTRYGDWEKNGRVSDF